MGFDGGVFLGERDDAGEDGADAVGVLVVIPIDADVAAVAFDQAFGYVIAEVGGDAGAGDAGDFGIFEGIGSEAAQALSEGKENFVGEADDFGALGISAEIEDEFVEADELVRVANPSAERFFEQDSGAGGGFEAEYALHGGKLLDYLHLRYQCNVYDPMLN